MTAVRFTDVMPEPRQAGWPGPVSFAVDDGSTTTFATTPGVARLLIQLMTGLRAPASGRVEVLGARPEALNRWETQRFRRRLGVAFHAPAGLVSNLTLRMNLVVPMLYSGRFDADTARQRADALLDRCELTRWSDRRPADVPPEVRQETVLARAVVGDPELLLLQEPTAGLRTGRASWLLSLCSERVGTVIITTAEREGVHLEVADAVVLLDDSGIEDYEP